MANNDMRFYALVGAASLCAMVWLGHCGSDAVGPVAAVDAATDTSTPKDATTKPKPKDASEEPSEEPDAGALDATRDIERPDSTILKGVWKEIPGIPNPNCLMAEDPNASVGPLEWQPCANNRAGCKKLKVTWSTKNSAISSGSQGDTLVKRVAGKVLLQYRREHPETNYGGNSNERIHVIQEFRGPVLAAISSRAAVDGCGTGSRVFTSNSAKIRLFENTVDRGHLVQFQTNFLGSLVSHPLNLDSPKLQGPSGATDTHLFSQTDGFTHVIYDTRSKQFVRNAQGDVVQIPFSVPLGATGGAFGMSDGEQGVMFASESGAYAMVTKSPPKWTTAIAIDDDDNERMYWVESDDIAPSTNPVLYTAPFSRSEAELAAKGGRRRITATRDASGTGGSMMIANGGLVLDLFNWNQAQLIRASDGKAWRVSAEPNEYFSRAMWVDDQEVWMATAITPPGEDPANGLWEAGILVIDRATLGEPTVLPE
jgi:hypothetical protein